MGMARLVARRVGPWGSEAASAWRETSGNLSGETVGAGVGHGRLEAWQDALAVLFVNCLIAADVCSFSQN